MTCAAVWAFATTLALGRIAATLTNPADADRYAVWMDSILRRYPFAMGESRFGADRIWYADVIGIWYQINDVSITVQVLSGGPARRH
ncbi:hypothetical protein FTUN_3204 [Frigoriglobus tundricola]|uniref:Type II toxin-antitoxin system RelE/ParE family toxin n=1 Tax=Frigoriglobus tundricola TaxID=2774151 RepID=A0A6M5YQE7_9BACT|nr:hypothetical protein FTUN_3204 [Frigoriglobus tundricola]